MSFVDAIRFRHQDGLLILQVKECTTSDGYGIRSSSRWRDAQVEDMLEVAPFMPDLSTLSTRLNALSNQIELLRYEKRIDHDGSCSTLS